ncbi:hypothetical protein CAPTEDRAFT_223017 [Capitella teleta]|uniref:Protein SSUH2 homolog n=1 Tax=Capitella teleta TaxID=283909 RepID=R7UH41_CAPTE|nr:hypothetical protein CAPTEDRAFT_223017 [Capitella teleta]|eukprot:ELU03118.1 hypothetical protein CAPTEDRAFT_223017 [Capitella teleta]
MQPGDMPAPGSQQMPQMQQFSGYEQSGGFGQMAPMAAPPPPPMPSGNPPPMQFASVGQLRQSECQDALLAFAGENCCYSKAPAKEHTVTNTRPSTALHYTLETFCESRTSGYISEPYSGQPINGPGGGAPPPPWSVPVAPDEEFKDHVKKLEVPGTATITPCSRCHQMGFTKCPGCQGVAVLNCTWCHGRGRRNGKMCLQCAGRGQKVCRKCGGDGRVTCELCNGYRQMKCFIQLVVTFKNHLEDHILETTSLPDKLIRDAQGKPIFSQTMPQVWPIAAYPVPEMAQASVRIVESHRTKFPNERRLNQRQVLRGVPVTEVEYTWNETTGRYWVYGEERKVYCPEYPKKCCCTIQ